MAICCPKSIKACALRITRQDACDRALDPLTTNSRIQTAGFMELNLNPDMEGGEDITTKNACGDICIRDKDQDRLKGFEVELKLCGLPSSVLEMLIGATPLFDDDGNIVGLATRESKDAPAENSKALEFWSKNAAKSCSTESNNLFIQWVLPRTINWELSGGLSFTNAALEVTLTGYAENNTLWVPSLPGEDFPSWVPGGGDPAGLPSGAPGPVLPAGVLADPWSLADQTAIRAGGPLAWRCVGALPTPLDDCDYLVSDEFASA